jgi:kumamolisin
VISTFDWIRRMTTRLQLFFPHWPGRDRKSGKGLLLGATLILVALAVAGAARAQSEVELTANGQAFGSDVVVLGDADDRAAFSFQVALKLRNADEFAARLGRGEQITDDDLQQRYLPTTASYQAVLSWLAASGIMVTRTYDNRVTVEAAGPVGALRRALHISFKRVTSEGAAFIASDEAPVVPAAIAAMIEGINGLQPYRHFDKQIRFAPPTAGSKAPGPNELITDNYFPLGILRVYQALPYLSESGKGTTTAILIDIFPHASDVEAFWKLTGAPQSLSNLTFIQTVSGTLPPPSGEESLDTEWASSIGYGSKVRVYATRTLSFPDIDSGMQAILSDLDKGVAIKQMSASFGGCERAAPLAEVKTENTLLGLIAAKNVSIFFSSGDNGAFECGETEPPTPEWPSTDPFVTAVGGTELIAKVVSSSKLAIFSETGWSGSGGGFSSLFAPPSYQAFLDAKSRVVPDVAADADPLTGVVIILNGSRTTIGGTSASTPIWAGFTSLINEARANAGKKPAGPLNPRIYPLLLSDNFHDVIGGCNGEYCAVRGYDLVTGIGSPIMNRLLPTLAAQP